MNYPLYKYQKTPTKRPKRRSTGWIVFHRITVGSGVKGICDFFLNDPEGVATVVVSGYEKRLTAIRDWRSAGVPQWAKEKAFVPYNFLVGKDGKIYKMLDDEARGAHCAGYNNNSIGVGVVGDFRRHAPTAPQILGCKKLARNLLRKYKRNLEESDPILTHDEVRIIQGKEKKNCPGIYLPIDEIRNWAFVAADIMALDSVDRN